jgi:HTH-type transcriptional regulator / antitoxin HipB
MIFLSSYGDATSMSTCDDTMDRPIISIRDLAAACRGRRQTLRLSQAELATRAAVSRQWLSEFERGKPTAELGLVIRLLEALDLHLSVSDGDQPVATRASVSAPTDLDALLDEHRLR